MKILDAATKVLGEAGGPLDAKDIHDRICRQGLFEFKAKDPLAILRGAMRKHLRSPGPHRIEQVKPGLFRSR